MASSDISQLEALRIALQAEADRLSLRVLAKRIGISHSTLAQFLDGTVGRPRVAAREKMGAYLQSRTESYRTAPPPPDTKAGAGAGRIPEELRSQPAYWRGRQDELVGMMEHIGQMMRQATVMHDHALATQREIIANTSPQPRPPRDDEEPISPDLYPDADVLAAEAERQRRRGKSTRA